eukprot:CAMPEP_0172655812 /NCGR_PEP_ID=MMETSP1074-20121228/941_1 /TAXON_ID=2916 /ORGANISM="Ceratium fusus, Strain PA161109" /LENGTH=207 /DNA_ID=CAMNT_0013470543 /DNA_START=233 /DNA_END=852 /DNA_ORIENTATION=-
MASLVQQRRAERHAVAGCKPKAEDLGFDCSDQKRKIISFGRRKCLSSGAFGDVYSTKLDNEMVALKQQDIKNPQDGLYVYMAEVWNHLQWHTEGFVQMKANCEQTGGVAVTWGCIAFELGIGDRAGPVKRKCYAGPNCNQADYIAVPQLLSDIALPLLAMHQAGWAHRDLKTGNIIIFRTQDRLVAKLGDLGMACKVVQGSAEGVVS